MASTRSSDAEAEDDNGDPTYSPKKVGRAAEFPEFAIIWSFLENFCESLRFPELSLDSLEDAFNSHSRRNENFRLLELLHKKLLSKLHKSFRSDKWEKTLLKVAKERNLTCSWDLESFGYDELKISSKLELFKMCLEGQFDNHSKLKENVNKNYEAEELRLQPFGRDVDGLIYWLHMDEHGGVRLYSTEEDEVESESWTLMASDLEELEDVVDTLEVKSLTNPKEAALVKREEEKKKLAKQNKSKKKGKKATKNEDDLDDDNPCARCFSNVHPDSILLCDKCDAAYHTACLRPPLMTIPQGDWFCPFCQQLVLMERLKEKRNRLVQRQRLRARQAKRLCKHGMNLSNILQGPDSEEEPAVEAQIRRSGRSRQSVDYTFKEFEDEIEDAVGKDKKRLKLDDGINGHPTGKPAFAVDNFYGIGAARSHGKEIREGKRKSRRLQDLDSISDSDSKTSEYEYDGSSDDEPKRPERHVYLRRHYRIEDDDEDEDDDEGNRSGKEEKEEKEAAKDDEITAKDKDEDMNGSASETSSPSKKPEAEAATESGDDDKSDRSGYANSRPSNHVSEKENAAEKDDPPEAPTSTPTKTPVSKAPVSKAPVSKPPPVTIPKVDPKIDPLLDSLGFAALAALGSSSPSNESFNTTGRPTDVYGAFSPTSPDKRFPLRPDTYRGSLSPTAAPPDGRFPMRPDPIGYPLTSNNMGVPTSPHTVPRVPSDSRYGAFTSYGQNSQYGNYFNYNQTDPGAVFAGSPTGQPPSYNQAMSSRQFPGYNRSISNRETSAFSQTPQSPSFNQTGSSVPVSSYGGNPYSGGGYSQSYPGTDTTTASRKGYYPSPTTGYGYPQPSPRFMPPDDPFGAITAGYGMAQRGGGASVGPSRPAAWSNTQETGAGMYFPQQSTMGNAGQQGYS